MVKWMILPTTGDNMPKHIFSKSYYFALLGALNLVSGLALAHVAAQMYDQPVLMGFVTLTLLNFLFGVNNFAHGMRAQHMLSQQLAND